jgi:thioredoxin 1
MVVECNSNEFEELVLKSTNPVIVDFWAPWCGPCRAVAPELEKFAEKNKNILIVKVNVDDNGELATQYQVRSIPTLILFKDGKAEKKTVGIQNGDSLEKFVN